MVLTYFNKEDANECNDILLNHKKCFVEDRDGKPTLIFQSGEFHNGFTIDWKVENEETKALLDKKITLVVTAYPIPDGQMFYNPVMPIRF